METLCVGRKNQRSHPENFTVSIFFFLQSWRVTQAFDFFYYVIVNMLVLPNDLIGIIEEYCHCDFVETSDGIHLRLRRCAGFEVRKVEDGRVCVFACVTQ